MTLTLPIPRLTGFQPLHLSARFRVIRFSRDFA